MYYLCTLSVGCEKYAVAKDGVFLLFKRKRDAKEYFAGANFEPLYEKVTLEEAKKLFGGHQYQII